MAGNYDDIDMRWTWNGDYGLGLDGDLLDTSNDLLLSLIQDCHTVCASELKDWEIYPNLGANLDDFIGEPNTRSRALLIHDRVQLGLVGAGIVADRDLTVNVVPIHRHKVLIILTINVMPTAANGLSAQTGAVRTALVFDFVEQGMLFWDAIPQLTAQ